MYQYVNPATSPSLIQYLQLASGTPHVYNFPGLNANLLIANVSDNFITKPESTMRVCPLQTYMSQYTSGCFKDPFLSLNISVFAYLNSSTHELNYFLTSMFSDLINPTLVNTMNYSWTFASSKVWE